MNQRAFALTVLLAAAFAERARAQLDLPDSKGHAPAGAPRELTAPQRGDLAGKLAPRSGTGGARRQATGPRASNGLDLPDSKQAPPPAPPALPAPAPTPSGAAPPPAAAPSGHVAATAADFVLAEVAKVRDIDSGIVDSAVQSLLRMGELGRAAAGGALDSEHAPTLMVGAKVLLQTGVPADSERVQARLRTKLPNAACAALVNALAAFDPVHASPAFLAELLAHRQSSVRSAAQRRLAKLGAALPAALLADALRAKDSDTRTRAVQLLSASADAAATGLLLERLKDSNAAVTRHAIDALATRDDAGLDGELLRRAFNATWLLRDQAYALLALVEREDQRLEPVLRDVHAEPLLQGLQSQDAFVAGACASALAGIGFRGTDPAAAAWLDLDVPHRLVRTVAGDAFSSDLSALAPTAVRRLALITGESFGSDGAKWIAWWSANAGHFHACRAALAARLEDAGTLELRVVSNLDEHEAFALLGPGLAGADSAAAGELQGETLFLSESQARGLFEVLRAQGLFSAERLPGARGGVLEAGRTLSIAIAGQRKTFRFGARASEPWLVAALEAARALRERNRWQRYRDAGAQATQAEFWRAQAPWWDAATDALERDRRLWSTVLAYLAHAQPSARDSGVAELERLQAARAIATAAEFQPLLALLRSEHFVGPRSAALLRLAIACARAGSAPERPALAEPLAHDLIDALVESFGAEAAREVSVVMDAAGAELTRAAARDERPFVRAVAAATLAQAPDAADLEALRGLLADGDPAVEAAAVLALGENKVEAARTEILIRARLGVPRVRAAALQAIGLLGGEEAFSVLLSALQEAREPSLAPAAAQGLALLRDPGAAPILIALLTKGADDPCYPWARKGLLDLREQAWTDLLRVVRSPAHRAKRDAALLLAEQLAPNTASALMTMLSEKPEDARVAEELAILTCVDFRAEPNPPVAWWSWWEYVVHDDAQAWFVGALGRLGAAAPSPDELRAGTSEALAFLAAVMERDESHLVEHARRELGRLLGRDPGALPLRGRQRDAWLAALRQTLEAQRK